MGFGHEAGGGNRDADTTGTIGGVVSPDVVDLGGQVGDAQHVLVGLGGQTQHEVELHTAPTTGKGGAAGVQQIFFGDVLVDGVTEPLGTCLGSEGQTTLAATSLKLFHEFHGEVVGTEGRQGDAYVVGSAVVQQTVTQGEQVGIVAGGERHKSHLLIAGGLAGIDALLHQQLLATVTDGTIDKTGLTEAAATDTAAEELQHDTVVGDLGGRDDGLYRVVGLVHVGDQTLGDLLGCTILGGDGRNDTILTVGHLIQRRDVNTGELGGFLQELVLGPVFCLGLTVQLDEFRQGILTFAQGDHIHKGGQRFGVIDRSTTSYHQGGDAGAVSTAQRQTRQVQHVQHIGVGHFVAQGEADDVKVLDGVAALQGVEGKTFLPHFLFHVSPGSEDTLTPDPGHVVHNAVEDAHAKVGHADLIGVREAEGEAAVHLSLVLLDGLIFAAHIAAGLLDPGQDFFQFMIHRDLHCSRENFCVFTIRCQT